MLYGGCNTQPRTGNRTGPSSSLLIQSTRRTRGSWRLQLCANHGTRAEPQPRLGEAAVLYGGCTMQPRTGNHTGPSSSSLIQSTRRTRGS